MPQSVFLKEDVIPDTQNLKGFQVVVHNPELKQLGTWHTTAITCELHHNYAMDAYSLDVDLTAQGYQKIEPLFIQGDRFEYAWKNKVILSTARRITELIQRLLTTPRVGFAKDVVAYKQEYLLPELQGNERLGACINLGDALKNWFEDKVSDSDNIWFAFLRDILEFVDWQLVAQYLDSGHWPYEPRLDNPLYDFTNSLTWSVYHYMESRDFPVKTIVKRHNGSNIDLLADELQEWFIKQLPYSVTRRNIFSQLMLTGIHCVDWFDIARSLLPDAK